MDLVERNEIISSAIKRQLEVMRNPDLKKVKLADTESVRQRTQAYFDRCLVNGAYPSISGLCAEFGISRQYLYDYIRTHSDETTDFIASVRESICDMLSDVALKGQANCITSIFLLKNLGYSDKTEIEINGAYAEQMPTTAELLNKYSNTESVD